MDSFQFAISKGDNVAIVQVLSNGFGFFFQVEAEHAALLWRFLYPKFIGLVGFGRYAILFLHECITKRVVEVQVSV